uniref:Reverse transcriptase domain-containing protein n=1 Tax=Lactuca sativa TaxID=4236 RepID=A0A9R1VA33_LACSA|nr:hypothetical protein LSAT_V11C600329270 [Lactuca sativa]
MDSSYSFLFKGVLTEEFFMEKGVRQGDPLSHFLFILAIKGLKVMMDEALQKGIFQDIELPNFGPNISLFRYVNDANFVGEWSKENARNLRRILTCFYIASSLKVNFKMCRVMGIGVSRLKVSFTACLMKCKEGDILFLYLGMRVGGMSYRVST